MLQTEAALTRSSSVLVSIGMPVHNGERHLPDALDSLLRQTHEDFELLIADNASTDGTEEISRSYVARDKRVKYVRSRQNLGVVSNFNLVFRLTQGRYFKWASSDDICEPQFLADCLAVLQSDASVVLACSRVGAIDQSGTATPYPSAGGPKQTPAVDRRVDMAAAISPAAPDPVRRWQWMMANLWWTPLLYGLIRGDVLSRTPLHSAHFMGDHVLLAELALHGRFYEVPEELLYVRLHGGQTSRTKSARGRLAVSRPDRARGPLLPLYLAWVYPERFLAHAASIHRAPLTNGQRIACYFELTRTVAQWGRAKGKRLLGVVR